MSVTKLQVEKELPDDWSLNDCAWENGDLIAFPGVDSDGKQVVVIGTSISKATDEIRDRIQELRVGFKRVGQVELASKIQYGKKAAIFVYSETPTLEKTPTTQNVVMDSCISFVNTFIDSLLANEELIQLRVWQCNNGVLDTSNEITIKGVELLPIMVLANEKVASDLPEPETYIEALCRLLRGWIALKVNQCQSTHTAKLTEVTVDDDQALKGKVALFFKDLFMSPTQQTLLSIVKKEEDMLKSIIKIGVFAIVLVVAVFIAMKFVGSEEPRLGACCIGESCEVKTADDCAASNGQYKGSDTSCSGVDCGDVPEFGDVTAKHLLSIWIEKNKKVTEAELQLEYNYPEVKWHKPSYKKLKSLLKLTKLAKKYGVVLTVNNDTFQCKACKEEACFFKVDGENIEYVDASGDTEVDIPINANGEINPIDIDSFNKSGIVLADLTDKTNLKIIFERSSGFNKTIFDHREYKWHDFAIWEIGKVKDSDGEYFEMFEGVVTDKFMKASNTHKDWKPELAVTAILEFTVEIQTKDIVGGLTDLID